LLRFGTGAGITWGSDPEREWAETRLKARRLLTVASGAYRCGMRMPYRAGS
jgi:para-aminobenzoate synthetase component 1